MKSHMPIILIDDDDEDLELFTEGFKALNLPNDILTFNEGTKFLDYIKKSGSDALLILCDVNMHVLSGLELKKIILDDPHLRLKCIPFLFFSTSNAMGGVREAYSLCAQGYFVKPSSVPEMIDLFGHMIGYWGKSEVPSPIIKLNYD